MNDRKEIFTTIESVVRNVLNNQKLNVAEDSKLMEDLGLESIDLLDLSSELENSIGKELDFKEVAQFVKSKSGGAADMKAVRVKDLMDFIVETNA
jgi:acyl carrier protein